MQFPNAYKGVKKMFTAQIISLVAALLLLIIAVIVLVSTKSNANVSDGTLVTIGLMFIVMSVLVIIAAIMQIMGLVSAGKDENSFKIALWVSIIAAIISSIGSARNVSNQNAVVGGNGIIQSISSITSVLVMYFIITGIRNLAVKLNDSDMERQGKGIINSIGVMLILSLAASAINVIFGNSGLAYVGILQICASLINIIISILFIVYIGKAKTMLKK